MTHADAHYRKMTETPVALLVLRLGIPTTISMLITSIYNMADTYFVGTLGESAQAATGVLFTLQTMIQGVAFMLGQGCGTYISRELADKNTDNASMYVSSAFAAARYFCLSGLAFLRASSSKVAAFANFAVVSRRTICFDLRSICATIAFLSTPSWSASFEE